MGALQERKMRDRSGIKFNNRLFIGLSESILDFYTAKTGLAERQFNFKIKGFTGLSRCQIAK